MPSLQGLTSKDSVRRIRRAALGMIDDVRDCCLTRSDLYLLALYAGVFTNEDERKFEDHVHAGWFTLLIAEFMERGGA